MSLLANGGKLGEIFKRLSSKLKTRPNLPVQEEGIQDVNDQTEGKGNEQSSETKKLFDEFVDGEIIVTDFKTFCNEIEKFIQFTKDCKNFTTYIHKYPEFLHRRLKRDAEDLKNLLKEISETYKNIKQLRAQSKMVKCENISLKQSLRKLKHTEIKELENVVRTYDPEMYSSWNLTKNKTSLLKEFLIDIQEKRFVLDSLIKLTHEKLNRNSDNVSSWSDISKSTLLMIKAKADEAKIPVPPPFKPMLNARTSPRSSRAYERPNENLKPAAEKNENEPYVFDLTSSIASSSSFSSETLNKEFKIEFMPTLNETNEDETEL